MKNEIYRFTLFEEGFVDVPSLGPAPKEPGLLSVCREIRKDARAIYYEENKFRFKIIEFDATRYLRFTKVHPIVPNFLFGDLSRGCWPNLKVWLKAFYEGWAGCTDGKADDPLVNGAARMF